MQRTMQRTVSTAVTLSLSLALLAACATDSAVGPGSPALDISSDGIHTLVPSDWTVSSMALPAGFTQGAAYQINSTGRVVGGVWNATGPGEPVLWTNGVPALVSVPAGYVGGYLTDITDAGQMVGYVVNAAGVSRAFKASAQAVAVLGDLGFGSYAYAIGGVSNGKIIGSINDMSGNHLPARWSTSWGSYALLPLPSGWIGGFANDINATGDVVGAVYNSAGQSNGYLWRASGTAQFVANYATSHARTISPDGTIGFDGTVSGITASPYVANTVVWSPGNVWSINALNRVVGNEGGSPATSRAGVKTILPASKGQLDAWARGINDCGNIVGQITTPFGIRPLKWTRMACEL